MDPFRSAYILGVTDNPSFPVAGPHPSAYKGGGDLFLAKVDSVGNTVYSEFLGGSAVDDGRAIAVDQNGNVVFAGATRRPICR